MIRGLSKFLALAVTVVFVGFSLGDEPKKESPEQRRERLQIAVQAICPVSGESLTSHAKPVKMTDPETKEVLYVCCEDCLKSKPDAKHLDKIRANFAKAQGHCLVMTDNEVSEKSKMGIVEGHAVFVCCPPCIKKMTAAPEKFLAKLDDLYEASLKQ
jgi:hypothetical protein